MQSTTFVLASIQQFNIVHDVVAQARHDNEVIDLYDEHGYRGNLLDHIWIAWRHKVISGELGTHFVEVSVPANWFSILNGQRCHFVKIGAMVNVSGHVQTLEGEGRQHSLLRAEDKTMHSHRTVVEFAQPAGKYELQGFATQADLQRFIESVEVDHFFHVIRVPRVRAMNKLYWPPSDEIIERLNKAVGSFGRGEGTDPRLLDFLELEGTNIGRAWEPVATGYVSSEATGVSGGRELGGAESDGVVVTEVVYNAPDPPSSSEDS